MNRFRTKKKQKEVEASTARLSEDSEQSSLPFRGFRSRKKVLQEETKPEFDLATALPSTDEFRTSLLMSNLSARFSMLREQDDPNTKIGKASDDSVLFPNRQSRMADFGFSGGAGLADIAEVESIRAATFLRKDSFASDDTDMKAGIINRSKPLEGNNLFGGRQKVYKIPAGSKAAAGGLGGRALYDDDVPMSAFQKWRQAERERSMERGETDLDQPEEDVEPTRSASPPPSAYNQKRETSSTMSSASNLARNSTAATSITSQTANSVKESSTAATSSTSSNTGPVTRARRLYEQGLTQDLQDQQSSALSRIDTMTRQRPFGTRNDLGSAPSPSTAFALDRSVSERRAMLAKASAPNLRTPSSATTASPVNSTNSVPKASPQSEPKTNFGAAPPLSPPISETGEQSFLPIQPNDVGKATALGMFQKPSQPYDESTYAQRQIQLQQGRETPTPKISIDGSSSLSPPSEPSQAMPPTPVPDSDVPAPSIISGLNLSLSTGDLSLERPADEDHPALRQSALPTPLSIIPGPPPTIHTSSEESERPVPIDSPTLGPTPGLAGLSGMVRQHLRSESTNSSIYDGRPQTSGIDSRFNTTLFSPSIVNDLASRSNPWMNGDQEWAVSYYGGKTDKQATPETSNTEVTPEAKANIAEEEVDEFASQLANARRRVKEKLNSYVESDSSRAGSPVPQESAPSASSTTLSFGILKSKSSKGSIVERSRNTTTGPSKVTKMLGIGAATMSTSPLPTKQSFDEKDVSTLATMREESRQQEAQSQETRHSSESANSGEAEAKAEDEEKSRTPMNPGLRAFRNAKRELQKQRELETLVRRQITQTSPSADGQTPLQPPPRADRSMNQRSPPSGERRPPPVTYRPRAPSDESNYSNSPSGRDRSGSERSDGGGRSHSRPPRLMTNGNMMPHDQLAPGGARTPMMRSPGLPGTDIKGSPIMPPHPYPGRGVPSPAASPMLNQSRSVGNLALHTNRLGFDVHPGQPSPISPMGLPSPSPYGAGAAPSPAGTPTSFGPRIARQSSVSQSPALGPVNGKRIVDKREISEPTLMSATTRVPTVNLPHQRSMGDGNDRGRPYPESRSRSSSRGGAPPPLPPINPRRRRDESSAGRMPEDSGMTAPRLPFASQANHSASSLDHASEDEMGRRRLRKARPSDGPAPPSPRTSGGTRDKGALSRMNPGMGPGGMI
ncbi:hypothetical protein QBC41DRAFT_269507 [Cercophora samala]|uniref:Uncharacterized protein n=1 Tax=Cercophora samala TaxID=330535 RepID=A0AA39ZJ15_9PEZI|nr:hypothetical protein QBC41DRAFT_269507 [Cercophora samala]